MEFSKQDLDAIKQLAYVRGYNLGLHEGHDSCSRDTQFELESKNDELQMLRNANKDLRNSLDASNKKYDELFEENTDTWLELHSKKDDLIFSWGVAAALALSFIVYIIW